MATSVALLTVSLRSTSVTRDARLILCPRVPELPFDEDLRPQLDTDLKCPHTFYVYFFVIYISIFICHECGGIWGHVS